MAEKSVKICGRCIVKTLAVRVLFFNLALVIFSAAVFAAEGNGAQLKKYVAELNKHPYSYWSGTYLQKTRETIIKLALAMDKKPETPEKYSILTGRAAGYFKNAQKAADYQEAVNAFLEASMIAPWKAETYYNLGVAEEKAGNYKGAINNYRLYILANPKAKDREEVLAKIGKAEVSIESGIPAPVLEAEWCEAGNATACSADAPRIQIVANNEGIYLVVTSKGICTVSNSTIKGITVKFTRYCNGKRVDVDLSLTEDGRLDGTYNR